MRHLVSLCKVSSCSSHRGVALCKRLVLDKGTRLKRLKAAATIFRSVMTAVTVCLSASKF